MCIYLFVHATIYMLRGDELHRFLMYQKQNFRYLPYVPRKDYSFFGKSLRLYKLNQ